MDSSGTPANGSAVQLVDHVTCLHCWTKFLPEEILWRSEHRDLIGDPLLGDQEQLRFLANRFDLNGNAIDARGQICREIACPHCHLLLPRLILERSPLFVSILGTPYCGKSYFLASLATALRRQLPSYFKIDFTDADTVSNQALITYEEKLFLNTTPDVDIPLADLIEKTQLHSALYNRVTYGNQEVRYARPFSFAIEPADGHPNHNRSRVLRRILCLYDNAGEHFLPGHDSRSAPGTRHLSESSFLLFMFDPTQDPRWHAALRRVNSNLKMPATPHAGRQEGVLREAASRVRKLVSLPDGEKYSRPLLIVLNKADAWGQMLGPEAWKLPFVMAENGVRALHMPEVRRLSQTLRGIIEENIPELIFAAEGFCKNVYYLPVSALGTPPTYDNDGKALIKPSKIKPWFVTLPFLIGLSLVTKGMIGTTAGDFAQTK